MGMDQWPAMLAGFVAGAAIAALVAGLLQSLRGKQARVHLERVEQARKQAAQQLTQARRQVEQLQRDCHELRQAARAAGRPVPAASAASTEAARDSAEAARDYFGAQLQEAADQSDKPAAGFADTLILRPPGTS